MGEIIRLLVQKPRIMYIAATDGRYGGAMAVGDGIDGIGARQMQLNVNTPLEEWKKEGTVPLNLIRIRGKSG